LAATLMRLVSTSGLILRASRRGRAPVVSGRVSFSPCTTSTSSLSISC
jgi:hypothetical protein